MLGEAPAPEQSSVRGAVQAKEKVAEIEESEILVPPPGLEPGTTRLRGGYSTY